MALRTYHKDHVIDLIRIDDDESYRPGIRVGNAQWDRWNLKYAPGMVIQVEYEDNCNVYPKSVTVLWPIVPKEDFSSIAFQVVRKAFPQLRAPDLVSIQPMSVPSGLIFYIDYQYGSGSK